MGPKTFFSDGKTWHANLDNDSLTHPRSSLPAELPSHSLMQRVERRVAAHGATLPSPHPAHMTDHLGDSIYALAREMLLLAKEVTTILSRSLEFSRWVYPENSERGVLVLTGTP